MSIKRIKGQIMSVLLYNLGYKRMESETESDKGSKSDIYL